MIRTTITCAFLALWSLSAQALSPENEIKQRCFREYQTLENRLSCVHNLFGERLTPAEVKAGCLHDNQDFTKVMKCVETHRGAKFSPAEVKAGCLSYWDSSIEFRSDCLRAFRGEPLTPEEIKKTCFAEHEAAKIGRAHV